MSIYDNMEAIQPYVGKAFLVIVLMMNLVLLLNLIIAILSNTFMIFEPKSLSLYYDGVIDNISMYKYSKGFGALICGSPPFNILVVPFLPLYIFYSIEKLKVINKYLMWYVYSPVLLGATAFFFFANACMMPIGYLASLMFKINIMIRDVQKSKKKMMKEALFFFFCGPFMMTLSLFTDTYYFVRHMILINIEKLSYFKN
jgi:hypothetical protein